jgi:Type II CAAX prenyl endopeptidase Rce1-like
LNVEDSQPDTVPVVTAPDFDPGNAGQALIEETAEAPKPAFDLVVFLKLLAASLLGTLAILPFSYSLIKQMALPFPDVVIPIALAVTVPLELALSAAMIGLGLWLGPSLNMGRITDPDHSKGETSVPRRVWDLFGKPLMIGVALGFIIVLYLSKAQVAGANDKQIILPNAWEGLLASIGAGIREEIWLRFGLLTFFVWLGVVLIRPFVGRSQNPPPLIFWIANAAAALSFAAIHIPQAQLLLGLTAGMLVFIFVGNGVPGLVFGWLYWRRGLIAAMIAHFGLDLVLKVLVPLFSA